jgi:pyrophosphate--fructose-6-phosphate 1-phosphotransferase
MPKRVAILTAGGYAPCLSSAVGALIETYDATDPDIELIAYRHGYHGLLTGNSITIGAEERAGAALLHRFGGSPIGNSRVKLTNDANCRRRGLIGEDETALEVAAARLQADGVDVLHTIGGDDTNTAAADLAAYLATQGSELTVVGLPKTIDNDIVPIRQSLGAQTAAQQASRFAQNVLAEHGSNPRMLIVHEVMGRHCGWLTAATAAKYREWLDTQEFSGFGGNTRDCWELHGVYVPELDFDVAAEAERLRAIMDETGCVNVFLSEGAGVSTIVDEMLARGDEPKRDAFGHVRLDSVNPGSWFAKQFADMLGAEKTMVQKSGYFSRSAAANAEDLALIRDCAQLAVDAALRSESGVVGHDEEAGDVLRVCEFSRIKGGKAFDPSVSWFHDLLQDIGQPSGTLVPSAH